jgi:hypothetical protein
MASFWLAARRWDMLRVAASGLGLAIVLMAAAYAFAAIESSATLGGAVAAFAAIVIGGLGLLYAWRPGAGGLVD